MPIVKIVKIITNITPKTIIGSILVIDIKNQQKPNIATIAAVINMANINDTNQGLALHSFRIIASLRFGDYSYVKYHDETRPCLYDTLITRIVAIHPHKYQLVSQQRLELCTTGRFFLGIVY